MLLEFYPGPRQKSTLLQLWNLYTGFQLVAVYKSLNGLGPENIPDMFKEYKLSRALRSMDSSQLWEPRVQSKQHLAVIMHGTGINCQTILDVPHKTFLFSCAYDQALKLALYSYCTLILEVDL